MKEVGAKIGQWFEKAKNKYTEEKQDPNSVMSIAKNKVQEISLKVKDSDFKREVEDAIVNQI